MSNKVKQRREKKRKKAEQRRVRRVKIITEGRQYKGAISRDQAVSRGYVGIGHSTLKTDTLSESEQATIERLTGGMNKDLKKLWKTWGLEWSTWLWCLHCERFFQARDIRKLGEHWGGCAFEDCNGAGIDMDIFVWDSWPKQNPEHLGHWPKSTKELTKGMRCSIY